jgi:hypothetical protein
LANRLFVDELVSVGMVTSGDNPDADVVIYKSHPLQTEILPDGETTPSMDTSAESTPSKYEVRMDLSAIEDQDLRKTVEDRIADLESQIPAAEVDVTKDADPEVQDYVAKQSAEIAKLREDLEAERTARRDTEFIGKAAQYELLLGKAEEIGPVLAALADAAPDAYAKLESSLAAAAARKDLAKLFAEFGAGETEGDADPIAKRDVWVQANRKDGETNQQAAARFWKENPEMKEASRN